MTPGIEVVLLPWVPYHAVDCTATTNNMASRHASRITIKLSLGHSANVPIVWTAKLSEQVERIGNI